VGGWNKQGIGFLVMAVRVTRQAITSTRIDSSEPPNAGNQTLWWKAVKRKTRLGLREVAAAL
jgi:hypothetical protein